MSAIGAQGAKHVDVHSPESGNGPGIPKDTAKPLPEGQTREASYGLNNSSGSLNSKKLHGLFPKKETTKSDAVDTSTPPPSPIKETASGKTEKIEDKPHKPPVLNTTSVSHAATEGELTPPASPSRPQHTSDDSRLGLNSGGGKVQNRMLAALGLDRARKKPKPVDIDASQKPEVHHGQGGSLEHLDLAPPPRLTPNTVLDQLKDARDQVADLRSKLKNPKKEELDKMDSHIAELDRHKVEAEKLAQQQPPPYSQPHDPAAHDPAAAHSSSPAWINEQEQSMIRNAQMQAKMTEISQRAQTIITLAQITAEVNKKANEAAAAAI
jgi:hypothetical protein